MPAPSGWTARRAFGALALAGLASTLAPAWAAPEGGAAREAFVTNQGGDSLSVVDLTTLKSVAEIEIGGKPAGIALAPDRRTAYVTAPEGKEVVVVDAEARSVTARIAVGQGPVGIAVHPDGSRIYVADWYEHKLYAVDPVAGTVSGSVDVGLSPSGVAVTPDGKLVVTADRDSDEVSLIDAETLSRKSHFAVGARPFGVTIDAEGRPANTPKVQSDDVSVIDHATPSGGGTVKVGSRPYAVALSGGRGYVTDQYGGTVTVFDLDTLEVVGTVPVGEFPEGIEADMVSSAAAGRPAVIFLPDGSSTGGAVTLRGGAVSERIEVDWLTSRVSRERGS